MTTTQTLQPQKIMIQGSYHMTFVPKSGRIVRPPKIVTQRLQIGRNAAL